MLHNCISQIQGIFSQHCAYWCSGASAPVYQCPQWWICTHAFPAVYGLIRGPLEKKKQKFCLVYVIRYNQKFLLSPQWDVFLLVWHLYIEMSSSSLPNSSAEYGIFQRNKVNTCQIPNGTMYYLNQCWFIATCNLTPKKFSQILIKIQWFLLKQMHLKLLSVKWEPFCPDLNNSM